MTNTDRGKSSFDTIAVRAPASKKRRSADEVSAAKPQIGQALRSVYDQTVSEAIPDEMLALLGRLD